MTRCDVRLYATLADSIGVRPGEAIRVELAGATLRGILRRLGVDRSEVHLAIVDGRPATDWEALLRDGARVALFPPVGGG